MAISYDHLAPAVYLICLMWLAIITCLHLLPRSNGVSIGAVVAALWWLVLATSFLVIAPERSSSGPFSGFDLLPMATVAAAFASFAGLRALWWRLLIAALPSGAIVAGADYLPLRAIAGVIVAFAIMVSLLPRLFDFQRKPSIIALAAALLAATVAARAMGAPLIFAAGLISISAVLTTALIPVPNGETSWQDRAYHLAITVPTILAFEWAIFGY